MCKMRKTEWNSCCFLFCYFYLTLSYEILMAIVILTFEELYFSEGNNKPSRVYLPQTSFNRPFKNDVKAIDPHIATDICRRTSLTRDYGLRRKLPIFERKGRFKKKKICLMLNANVFQGAFQLCIGMRMYYYHFHSRRKVIAEIFVSIIYLSIMA